MGWWRDLETHRLRTMYYDGRGNDAARRYARLWSWAMALGLGPRRWATLEAAGGRPHVGVAGGAPLEAYARVADRHPVFLVVPR